MLATTNFNGLKEKGQVYDVPDVVAARWYTKGIATLRKEDIAKISGEEQEEQENATPETEEVIENEPIPVVCDTPGPSGVPGNASGKPSTKQSKTDKKGK